MKKLSTGHDSTLGSYLKLATVVFGKESKQVKFIEGKIVDSPNGENEEVWADENQMMHLMLSLK